MTEPEAKHQHDPLELDPRLLEARIEALEIRCAFQDDLVDSLNDTVAAQTQSLRDLQDQLRLLYQRVVSLSKDDGIAVFDPLSEIPPHY